MIKVLKGYGSYASSCQDKRTYHPHDAKIRVLGIRITFKYVHHV